METPTRTCPRGGVALIGQSFLDPAEHWTVTCTVCRDVGAVNGGRWQADDLAARHMREGWTVATADCQVIDGGTYCHAHRCGATDDLQCRQPACPHCGGSPA